MICLKICRSETLRINKGYQMPNMLKTRSPYIILCPSIWQFWKITLLYKIIGFQLEYNTEKQYTKTNTGPVIYLLTYRLAELDLV